LRFKLTRAAASSSVRSSKMSGPSWLRAAAAAAATAVAAATSF